MFDRNRNAEGPVSVEITLRDGRTVRGKLVLPPGRTLTEVLNGAAVFVDFEPYGGDRTFLAKASLEAIRSVDMPSTPSLGGGRRGTDPADPFTILGIAPEAEPEEIRRAYLKLAKIYHPDRYSTADLPPEVREYLAGMAQRVNAAYETVEAAHKRKAARPDPVFTSGAERRRAS